VVLEFATAAIPRIVEPSDGDEPAPSGGGRPLPRNPGELARDLRFIQMELLMSAEADGDGDRSDEDEDGA
jgi:hypothetical protein